MQSKGRFKMKLGAALMAAGIGLFIFGYVAKQQGTSIPTTGIAKEAIKSSLGADVVEFFWYGCPHCLSLEDEFVKSGFYETLSDRKSLSGNSLTFRKIPLSAGPEWDLHARLFYALSNLGMSDNGHYQTMRLINDFRPSTKLAVYDLLASHIAADEHYRNRSFISTPKEIIMEMFSPAVDSQIAESKQLSNALGVTSVPMIFVLGEAVAPLGRGNSYTTMAPAILDTIDELIPNENK